MEVAYFVEAPGANQTESLVRIEIITRELIKLDIKQTNNK